MKRTDAGDPGFRMLVKELDLYLAEMDGEEHDFYDRYNQLDSIRHVLVAYEKDQPVACGAIKPFEGDSVEVKRMYTVPAFRGRGLATQILMGLEDWAAELGYHKVVLETGKRQVEAVNFYHKHRYRPIANYGQYAGVGNSLCFEKILGD
jgi:GNAT superfamily N-acetyltransferase